MPATSAACAMAGRTCMLKLAVSADGKAGAAGRKPVAITGEAARERVHLMRAQSDAIMVGIGTALADDPILTCRLPGHGRHSPVRVVLDGMLRLPLGSRLVRSAREVAALGRDRLRGRLTAAKAALEAAGVTSCGVPARRRPARSGCGAASLLAERGISRLMVEAGPILAAALLEADLVDEARFSARPKSSAPMASMRWKGCRSRR